VQFAKNSPPAPYFHWGAYSVPAFQATSFGEWYGKNMNTPGTGENKHHIEKYGNPAEWPYHHFINGAKDKAGNWEQFNGKLRVFPLIPARIIHSIM
jgi:alpha-L-fucosidase